MTDWSSSNNESGETHDSGAGKTLRRVFDSLNQLLSPEPRPPAETTPARAPDAAYWDAVFGGGATVDMRRVHALASQGVPDGLRAVYWKLLLGYLPPERDLWPSVLESSRHSYHDLLQTLLTDPEQAADSDHVCFCFFFHPSKSCELEKKNTSPFHKNTHTKTSTEKTAT